MRNLWVELRVVLWDPQKKIQRKYLVSVLLFWKPSPLTARRKEPLNASKIIENTATNCTKSRVIIFHNI